MSEVSLTRLTYIGLIICTIGIWYSIFTNGFFVTTTGLIIFAVIMGLIFKITENK